MVELGYAVLVVIAIATVVLIRLIQFRGWYHKALVHRHLDAHGPVIMMLEFYDGSQELEARRQKTKDLYVALSKKGKQPSIVLTAGQLHGENEKISVRSELWFLHNGISASGVCTYGDPGAADTFQEVRLGCQYAHEQHRDQCVYVVANLLQATQAFMICIREGIFPNVELTPMLETSGTWAAGKLFHIILTFFSPRGHNPISWLQRRIRWHLSSKI